MNILDISKYKYDKPYINRFQIELNKIEIQQNAGAFELPQPTPIKPNTSDSKNYTEDLFRFVIPHYVFVNLNQTLFETMMEEIYTSINMLYSNEKKDILSKGIIVFTELQEYAGYELRIIVAYR